jgi:hypothetical protein
LQIVVHDPGLIGRTPLVLEMVSLAIFAAVMTFRNTPSEYGVTSEDFAFGPKTMSFVSGIRIVSLVKNFCARGPI